ncbi:glycosyltransferase family 2 protein [Vibrio sp. WJH972]
MKLIVQIPCYNEADNLADVVNSIPTTIPGISKVEVLVIDDGSTDGTADIARQLGVDHVVVNRWNRGLAHTFRTGIEECIQRGADIIVNTDGDNQYNGEDISLLVEPIVNGSAEIVVGNRGGYNNQHFSFFKRSLQVFGSFIIAKATGLAVKDAVSGFRAITRDVAQQLNIVSDFSYTIEMLVQASAKKLNVVSVPIRTNGKTRESRLFKNIPHFLKMSISTLVRVYTMYRPLRVFLSIGTFAILLGLIPILRFLYFYFNGIGDGHVQSLVLGTMLIVLGAVSLLIGMVADLVGFNRKLTEKVLLRMELLEERLVKNDQISMSDSTKKNEKK